MKSFRGLNDHASGFFDYENEPLKPVNAGKVLTFVASLTIFSARNELHAIAQPSARHDTG